MLIEPVDETHLPVDTSAESTLKAIWPSIQAVNRRFGIEQVEISRSRVIIAPHERPFSRLAKGSVDRKGTMANFMQEIESCYAEGGDRAIRG
jgi:hypothetical protein